MTSSRPSLLVVTMGTDYIAPARMPQSLQAAGFRVSLLAPENALATHTRFLDRLSLFPPNPTHLQWLRQLAEVVQRVDADLILPGDDITVRLLMQIVLEPLPAFAGDAQRDLAALVERSLGDPAHYLDSIDKARLVDLARRAGVPVPKGEGVANEAEALEVAASIGYPVFVRPAIGHEGRGIGKCAHADDLRRVMRSLPRLSGWHPKGDKVALVQEVLDRGGRNRPAAVWRGREIAGVSRHRLRAYPEPDGPGSVTRLISDPPVAAINARLMAALGATGFLSTQYMFDAAGEPKLIEVNRRMTPATHTGAHAGIDLAAAFAAALHGREWEGPTDVPPSQECTLALFPQEWLRDPMSEDLARLPTDAPFDDPRLFAAMLRIGRETPQVTAGRGAAPRS